MKSHESHQINNQQRVHTLSSSVLLRYILIGVGVGIPDLFVASGSVCYIGALARLLVCLWALARVLVFLCPLRFVALPFSTRSPLTLLPSSPIPSAGCPVSPPFVVPFPTYVSFCLVLLTFYLPPLSFPLVVTPPPLFLGWGTQKTVV